MAVKLTFGEPVVVAMGPERTKGWGTHQFPAVRKLPDGRIAVTYHVGNDQCADFGSEGGWAISDDNGATWKGIDPAELPAIKAHFGVQLPSGKYIRNIVHKPYPTEEGYYRNFPRRKLVRPTGERIHAIPIEDLPDDLFPKTWMYAVSDPDTQEETTFYCDLEYPGMNITLLDSSIVRPFPQGVQRVAPDGSLWQVMYIWGRNPENLGMTAPYYACYYFQSLDEGKSFKLRSWIQYCPDTNEFPNAFGAEGFCEPDLCFMPDGSMITLMRTGSGCPSYIARSTDGGSTWSKPVIFDRCGVLPQLELLDCGVTLATYGRPGLFIRATDDPSGQVWDDPIELMPYESWDDSCYYTCMEKVDDRTVLLVYSDFRVKDEAGVERKCIMFRTVHVD